MARSKVAEQRALTEIKHRLIREFSGVTEADVGAAVSHAQFYTSPIRDFVPLLVDKHAPHTLAQHLLANSA